ncbi:MAG: type II toxin-antitoxin system RelE/ParE family toxin [Chloroflexota bacterium]
MNPVIASFHDQGSEDVFNGKNSRFARRTCPQTAWAAARRKLDQLNRIKDVQELAIPPGNRLEYLRGNREGQYSIRINNQYRICFFWENDSAYNVEITDYH